MATAMAQPAFGLQPPAVDDTMEISSDFGHADDDIDIDFDQDPEEIQYGEDDQMLDDVKSERASVASVEVLDAHKNEDAMLDDELSADLEDNDVDGMMQDDASAPLDDEELLDFADHVDTTFATEQAEDLDQPPNVANESEPVELLDTAGSSAVAETMEDNGQAESPFHEAASTQIAEATDKKREEYSEAAGVEEIAEDILAHELSAAQGDGEPDAVADPPESALQPLESKLNGQEISVTELHGAAIEHEFEVTEANDSGSPDHDAHTEVGPNEEYDNSPDHEEQSDTPTWTGLHPTVVKYQGSEVALFPSSDPLSAEQYFLENENLVNSSIGEMLQACRIVLGESITENDELELGIEDLGLYLSEDSTPAFSTSFAEILDVFVRLQKYDGVENPGPLYMTLSTKTRFSNRLTLLTQAVSEGRGLSAVQEVQEYAYEEEAVEQDAEENYEPEALPEAQDSFTNNEGAAVEQPTEPEASQVSLDHAATEQSEVPGSETQDDLSAVASEIGRPTSPALDELYGDDEDEIQIPGEADEESSLAVPEATNGGLVYEGDLDENAHSSDVSAASTATIGAEDKYKTVDITAVIAAEDSAASEALDGNSGELGDNISTQALEEGTPGGAGGQVGEAEYDNEHPSAESPAHSIHQPDTDTSNVHPSESSITAPGDGVKDNSVDLPAMEGHDPTANEGSDPAAAYKDALSAETSINETAQDTHDNTLGPEFDEIDFSDDDLLEDHAESTIDTSKNSPGLKRSWEDHAESSEISGQAQDSKRVRSS